MQHTYMTSPGLIQDNIYIYNIELCYSDLYIASIHKIITLKNSIENETYMYSVPNDYKEVQKLQHNKEKIE